LLAGNNCLFCVQKEERVSQMFWLLREPISFELFGAERDGFLIAAVRCVSILYESGVFDACARRKGLQFQFSTNAFCYSCDFSSPDAGF